MTDTDLGAPASPDDVPAIIYTAAQQMREQAAELQAAWQDPHAGERWLVIAKELERAADRIEKTLSRA
jgi:hypothetical protein